LSESGAPQPCSIVECPRNRGEFECLEGHEPASECPNLRGEAEPDTAETASTEDDDLVDPSEEPVVDLWPGRPLTVEQADGVTSARRARVVLIAGVDETGKTTLMASMFDRFQRGPFGGFRFAGSRTLMAFEERCFESRLASGRQHFATQRTRVTDSPELLHLDLEDVESGAWSTLLLPDLAAERFETVINTVEAWQELPIIGRVDRVAVLVDGARMARDEDRWTCISECQTLVRGALEMEVVPASALDVVITKWDMVLESGAVDAARSATASVVKSGQRFASSELPDPVETAARSAIDEVPSGTGMEVLLKRWLAPAQVDRPAAKRIDRGERAFSQFGWNTE
jgi:hypothetical protein